jgi:hypothetical protein
MILIAHFFLTVAEILDVDAMVALGQTKLQRNVAYPLVVVYPLLPTHNYNVVACCNDHCCPRRRKGAHHQATVEG